MNINEQYEAYRNKTGDELMETLIRLTAELWSRSERSRSGGRVRADHRGAGVGQPGRPVPQL